MRGLDIVESSAPLETWSGPDSWQGRHQDELVSARKHLQRNARLWWAEFVRELMPWALIVNAATFDEGELGHGVTREAAKGRFRRFMEQARFELGRPAEGFMACEAGPAGGVEHGHGLLSLGEGLRAGDVTALSRLWRAVKGNGFIRLEACSGDWFAVYASKHTVKQQGDIVLTVGCGRQWYDGWAVESART